MSEIIRSPSAHLTMWRSLSDSVYRHAYAAAHVGDYLAMQLFSMRKKRKWTQKQLADESGILQPQISNLESSCQGVNLSTLHKLAQAFDVALIVKFVPFSHLARETINSRADQYIPSFDEESVDAIGFREVRLVPVETRSPTNRTGNKATAYATFRKPIATDVHSSALSGL